MKFTLKRVLAKASRIAGLTIISLLALLFILPYLFPDTIAQKIKGWANSAITSKLEFSKARLSFFNHFPSLTLTLHNVSLTGSAPFEKDTLVNAKEIALGIDLTTLFSESVKINKIFLSQADVQVLVNEKGQANYNIYQPKETAGSDTASGSAGLQLESIVIENSNLEYTDQSVPLQIMAGNLNYSGKGDLSKAIFDLSSRLKADTFSFVYNGEPYVNKKSIRAKLVTQVNTNSLALVFEKNRIRINQLPVQFSGTFNFLKNGYDMDFRLASPKATLEEIITVIPPDLNNWLDDTKVKGAADFNMELKGQYIWEHNVMPTLNMGLKIKNGYIAHKGAPAPVENLLLNMQAHLPSLNTDSMDISIDSLYFALDKGYFSATSHTIGLEQPYIKSQVKTTLDLEKWDKALGLKDFEIKGEYTADFKAEGKYTKGQNPARWRKDIIVTGIPAFTLHSSLKNGYFKYTTLPESIHDINFTLNSSCPDSNYKHSELKIENLNAVALKNAIRGQLSITSLPDPFIEANLTGNIQLQEINRFLPLDSIRLTGDALLTVESKGVYNPDKKLFPLTKARLALDNGTIQTPYYPQPVQKIKVISEIINTTGQTSGTDIHIQPVSFEFEGQPFLVTAVIKNPDDLEYDVVSEGTLDLGRIYKVFAVKGYDLTGFIEANLSLKGKQSDALAGRYNLLLNRGTLNVKEITLHTESFPQPFLVNNGKFRFNQDKMWFDTFNATYGKSSFTLNGYMNNVINYLTGNDETLHGRFALHTDHINLNEFTAFATPDSLQTAADTASGTGVVMIPDNLSVNLTVTAGTVDYNGTLVKNLKATLAVDSGRLQLTDAAFRLADAAFKLSALYTGVTPRNAQFNFTVKADSFSIAKAYNDIPMFREMASSASGVQGIVGLDYTLAGRLDENMSPVYPSLKGGGVLLLKNVKLKGFKLMNAVSQSAEKPELKDGDVKGIQLKSNVANNILNIERVKMRIAGFRPRFEGQASLDGNLNLKGRIGLPPLGIIGIPFTVSGTSDNPQVKLKRDKSGKVLEETADKEDEDDTTENDPGQL
ncbi:MAG: AsmA family protein [Chitinophagaceae bacterium]|nr:AsmA family protein [Chitinophagaceae bacterium]